MYQSRQSCTLAFFSLRLPSQIIPPHPVKFPVPLTSASDPQRYQFTQLNSELSNKLYLTFKAGPLSLHTILLLKQNQNFPLEAFQKFMLCVSNGPLQGFLRLGRQTCILMKQALVNGKLLVSAGHITNVCRERSYLYFKWLKNISFFKSVKSACLFYIHSVSNQARVLQSSKLYPQEAYSVVLMYNSVSVKLARVHGQNIQYG